MRAGDFISAEQRGASACLADRWRDAIGAELFFSEKEGGMGVGLNVVQEILTAHGGKMHLRNHPEGGAVVTIMLPQSGA